MISDFDVILEVDTFHQVAQAILLYHPAIQRQHGRHYFKYGLHPVAVKSEVFRGDILPINIQCDQWLCKTAIDITQ